MSRPVPANSHQGGFATLGIAAMLLAILSLMAIYLLQSGINDMRTTANKARHAQALADAERSLATGLGWLSQSVNRLPATDTSPATFRNPTSFEADAWLPCSHQAFEGLKVQVALGADWRCILQAPVVTNNVRYVIATLAAPRTAKPTYQIIAEGVSNDTVAKAVVKQGLYFYASDGTARLPPLMGAGSIELDGPLTLVPHPNSGGQGVPIAIWSQAALNASEASVITCPLGEYIAAHNSCSTRPIGQGIDMVEHAADFPTDVFQYLFGIPTRSYGTVKAQATVLPDCTHLATRTANRQTGIFWITGDCDIGSNTVGQADAPIQLIVESGNFTMQDDSAFYGLLLSFGPPPGPSYNAGSITIHGRAHFFGSIVSNDASAMVLRVNGTFHLVYSQAVIEAFGNPLSNQFRVMTKIPGSWADFL